MGWILKEGQYVREGAGDCQRLWVGDVCVLARLGPKTRDRTSGASRAASGTGNKGGPCDHDGSVAARAVLVKRGRGIVRAIVCAGA